MSSIIVLGPPPHIPPPSNFNGQWIGPMLGTTPGLGMLELDVDAGWITGAAYLFPTDPQIVPAMVKLRFPMNVGPQQFQNIPVTAFAPDYASAIDRQQMSLLYPLSDFSDTTDATLAFSENSAFVTFKTPMSNGFGNLRKAHSTPSGIVPIPVSWEEFRSQMFNWPGIEKFVFRGQRESWPLRTTFHRTSKKNLDRYTHQMIHETHRALANKLGHKLDLTQNDDLGSFYSILQHHGYPTPLLDWTSSPWVAAYFAFENAEVQNDKSVRVFAFDRTGWLAMLQQNSLTMTRPHVSFVDLVARGNDRAEPQASVFTISTVDDIEAHIVATEARYSQQYLWAIDIPTTDRERALADLDNMGCNRSRLFPDLDGICRSMRIKHFGLD